MKKSILFLLVALFSVTAFSQDIAILLKEADNYDKQLKEKEALDKYNAILGIDSSNTKALLRVTEINCAIGARQTDKKAKPAYFNLAAHYAQKLIEKDGNSADANYAMSLVADNAKDAETEYKKIAEAFRQEYEYASKALQLDSNHAKANYLLGKWNYEVVTMAWAKKTASKAIFGGLPKADIDKAIYHLEKARSIEQYFAADYMLLAKAYKVKNGNKPAQSIEILNKLIKLPNRTPDDAAIKEEAKKMLQQEML